MLRKLELNEETKVRHRSEEDFSTAFHLYLKQIYPLVSVDVFLRLMLHYCSDSTLLTLWLQRNNPHWDVVQLQWQSLCSQCQPAH